MLKYKKSFYKRRKYLIYICKKLNINIIYFLDESLEKMRIHKNMKRISINKYLNNSYKYCCKRLNIQYEDLIDTKNNFSIMKKFLMKYMTNINMLKKMKMIYFFFRIFLKYWNILKLLT